MQKSLIPFVIVSIHLFLQDVSSEVINGVAPLNAGVFDKVLSKFKATLVKFDESYPYGEKHDQFKKLVEDTKHLNDLLIGEVNIADYGDKDNFDLGERFKIDKNEYPAYRLYLGRNDIESPIVYDGDAGNVNDLKRFIAQNTGIWIGLPGCIEKLDLTIDKFYSSPEEDKSEIINNARDIANEISDDSLKLSAQVYIKTMEKIIERGINFVVSELKRVEKLSNGKVSENKRKQLKERSNILLSFKSRLQKEEL